MPANITTLLNAKEAQVILLTIGLRPTLYALARYTLGLRATNPYEDWAK